MLLGLTLAAGCGGSGGGASGTAKGSGAARATESGQAGQSAAPASGAPDQGSATITIDGTGFGQPQTVNPGEPIKLINKGSAACTLKSGAVLDVVVPAGGSASITAPTVPGAYPLSCGFSPDLHGTLNVRGV